MNRRLIVEADGGSRGNPGPASYGALVRDAAWSDADRDRDWVAGERRSVLADIPADLLALYEKLRADHNGVGAAALRQRRCEGCRMELTPTDIGRIRDAAPDAVLRCEECRRILVRTPESGL